MSKSIKELKDEYVAYYNDVPVQKYAAMHIGRDEDTIIRWRKEDMEFADAVQRAKAEWVRKKVLATKAEFALERLEKSVFSPTEQTSFTVATAVKEITDPNAPDSKKLVEASLVFLMAQTKRVPEKGVLSETNV